MAMSQVFKVKVTRNGKMVEHVARVGGGSLTEEGLGAHYQQLNVFPGADEVYIEEMGEVPEIDAAAAVMSGPPRKVTPKAKVKNPSEPVPATVPAPGTSKGVSLPPLGTAAPSNASNPQNSSATPPKPVIASSASSLSGQPVKPPVNPAAK